MAHTFVHAADQHHQRRPRGQRQIAEDRQSKSERDGHTGEDAKTGDADKEDDEVDVAERTQPRLPANSRHRLTAPAAATQTAPSGRYRPAAPRRARRWQSATPAW